MTASLAWPLCAPMALLGVLTFALLGCSLRRMRSRDRLTVLVWWFASVCCVGGGLWGTWALGLAALTPAARRRCSSSRWRWPALALVAATVVSLVHFVARLDWPEAAALRRPHDALHGRLGWRCSRSRAAAWRRARPWPGRCRDCPRWRCPPRSWPPAAPRRCGWCSASAGATPAASSQRLWLCAATLGGCHAAALLLVAAGAATAGDAGGRRRCRLARRRRRRRHAGRW